MKSTDLMQLVDKLQQAGKIHNLQQDCGVSGCVSVKYLPIYAKLRIFFGTDEDPKLRIESYAIINLGGVSTRVNL